MPLPRPSPLPRYSHTKGRQPPYRKTSRKELTPLQRAFICGFLEAGGSGREITRRFDIPHNTALRVLKTAKAKAEELGVGLLDGRCYETKERGHRARVERVEAEGDGQGVGEGNGEVDGEGKVRVKSHMQGGCLVRGYVRKRPREEEHRGGRGNKKVRRMSEGGVDGTIDPVLREGDLQGMGGGGLDMGMNEMDFASLFAATNGHDAPLPHVQQRAP